MFIRNRNAAKHFTFIYKQRAGHLKYNQTWAQNPKTKTNGKEKKTSHNGANNIDQSIIRRVPLPWEHEKHEISWCKNKAKRTANNKYHKQHTNIKLTEPIPSAFLLRTPTAAK